MKEKLEHKKCEKCKKDKGPTLYGYRPEALWVCWSCLGKFEEVEKIGK